MLNAAEQVLGEEANKKIINMSHNIEHQIVSEINFFSYFNQQYDDSTCVVLLISRLLAKNNTKKTKKHAMVTRIQNYV